MATETTVFLGEFETKALQDLDTLGPGTYYVKLMINCNSLLSSVYIKASAPGTTIKANYFDTTTGSEFTSERYDLESHPILTDANVGETHRILVSRIHNKPQLELIITGGSVEMGVYGTAVSSSASDIDNALVRDGDTFVPADTKAMPVACLDEVAGELRFLRCPIPVEISGGFTPWDQGDTWFLRGNTAADPGNTVSVFSNTVPADITRWLKQLWVTAVNDGEFSLKADGLEIATGRIDITERNIPFKFDPPRPIDTGVVLELFFTADQAPNHQHPVTAFLSGNDVATTP